MDKIRAFIKFAIQVEEQKKRLESVYPTSIYSFSKNVELLDLLKELKDMAKEANVLGVHAFKEDNYTVQVEYSTFVKLTAGLNIIDSTLDNWTHCETEVEGIHLVCTEKNASALAPASKRN